MHLPSSALPPPFAPVRDRRPRARWNNRREPALAIAIATLACSTGTARAAAPVQITPVGDKIGQYSVRIDLAEPSGPTPDVVGRPYGVTAAPGAPAVATTVTGYSFGTILATAEQRAAQAGYPGFSPSSFSAVEVTSPSAPVILSSAEATSPTAFPDGPPVMWADPAGTHFLRPSAGANDPNGLDTFASTSAGGLITVYLHSGAKLTVDASASASKAAVGQRVTFSSTTTGALEAENLQYQWRFDDGQGASQPQTTHSFAAAGTYNVYLRVSGDKDSIGVSAIIPVTVGTTPKGPNREGGGTSKNPKAPTHGTGVTGHTKSGQATKRDSKSGSSGSTSGTAAAVPNRAATAKPRPNISSARATKRPARKPASPTRSVPPRGPVLSGIALTSQALATPTATPRPASSGSTTQAARTGHLTSRGTRPAGQAALGAGLLASLLAGGLLQAYGRPRLRPLSKLLRRRGELP